MGLKLRRLDVVAAVGAAVAAAMTCGCSTLTEVNAGPVVGLSKNDDPAGGVAANAHAGLGVSTDDAVETLGVDVVVRGKITKTSQQLAFGEGVFLSGKAGKLVTIVRVGGHLAFERFDDRLLVGGGPSGSLEGGFILGTREYFSPGLFIDETRRERTLLTFGPSIELDARFTRPTTLAFIGFTIGVAWANDHVVAGHVPDRPAEQPATQPTQPTAPPAPGNQTEEHRL